MTGEERTQKPDKRAGVIAAGGAASGLAALIGASCCVLPLILINLGVSAALVGKLAFFARAQPYFMAATGLLIAAAIIAAFWNGRRPSRRVAAALILASFFVIGAYIMPFYEGALLRWINFR